MGIRERRERERRDVRERILDAARDLFVRDGYDAVTMRKIAEAIEYSPTAIYLHFADKESLIRALCEEDFLALARAFQRIAKEPDPIERIRKIGHAYVDFALDHPNHYRLMFMTPRPVEDEPPCEGTKGNVEEDAYAFLVATVSEAIGRGLLRPDLKDPDLVAQGLWAGVHGVASLQITLKSGAYIEFRPARKLAALVIDAALAGMSREGK